MKKIGLNADKDVEMTGNSTRSTWAFRPVSQPASQYTRRQKP